LSSESFLRCPLFGHSVRPFSVILRHEVPKNPLRSVILSVSEESPQETLRLTPQGDKERVILRLRKQPKNPLRSVILRERKRPKNPLRRPFGLRLRVTYKGVILRERMRPKNPLRFFYNRNEFLRFAQDDASGDLPPRNDKKGVILRERKRPKNLLRRPFGYASG